MAYKINHDNIKDWAKNYDGPLFDGILCDPPYELGFMGKSWDKSGIAYDKDMWADLLRILKPGGHLIAFSGSRTYHRMAVAIEDAGFEIRDMIEWVYGSGFPKSLNIGKAVDKIQGNEREQYIDEDFLRRNPDTGQSEKGIINKGLQDGELGAIRTKGTSEWEGYGTALKPAHEPCVLARKPIEGTVANNVLKHGTGGLNIDGARVEVPTNDKGGFRKGNHVLGSEKGYTEATSYKPLKDGTEYRKDQHPQGRFPANLIHDGSDEVEAVFPQTKTHSMGNKATAKSTGMFGVGTVSDNMWRVNDSGSASRFFYTAKSSRTERNLGLDSTAIVSIQYKEWNDTKQTLEEAEAKLLVAMDTSLEKVIDVSGIESKNATAWNTLLFGSELMEKYPISTKSTTKTTTSLTTTSVISNWLTGLLINEYTAGVNYETENGGSPVASAENSNTLTTTISEKMASALGVKNVQSGTQLRISVKDGSNFHSTVKPLSLTKYLATLIKPPTGGRLLVPFSGSGSEMIGALQAGWEYVEGVELTEEYIPIAEARVEYWTKQATQQELV